MSYLEFVNLMLKAELRSYLGLVECEVCLMSYNCLMMSCDKHICEDCNKSIERDKKINEILK